MVDEPDGRRDEGRHHGGETAAQRITRGRLVKTAGVAAAGAAVVWTSPFPFSGSKIGQTLGVGDASAAPTGTSGPTRAGYCSVAGNTFPDGTAIAAGTFLDLIYGQPDNDPHYSGATLAIYVQGKGITCDPPPPGYVHDGKYNGPDAPPGVYDYYRAP
jgi:hypothetical protein